MLYASAMSENEVRALPPIDDGLAELEAMRTVAGALKGLDAETRDRVLRWTLEKYATHVPRPPQGVGTSAFQQERGHAEERASTGRVTGVHDLAEIYARALPKTDAEKTLVVSYWLQEVEGASGIDAQSVNSQLKNLGHGVGNITRAFDRLMQNRPQLMIQTKKSGSTKQARKTFRVTLEGKNFVEQMREGGGTI